MEERLRFILGQVNEWLKFAEAKNGALLVAASSLILALLSNYPNGNQPFTIRAFFLAGTVFLFAAAALCLLSFLPQLKVPVLSSRRRTVSNYNLFFFGDIADHSPSKYLEALYLAEGSEPKKNTKVELDLAGQVVINSRITFRKFQFFSSAVWLALVGVSLLGSAAVLFLIR